jgi:hypothetical protein
VLCVDWFSALVPKQQVLVSSHFSALVPKQQVLVSNHFSALVPKQQVLGAVQHLCVLHRYGGVGPAPPCRPRRVTQAPS